VKSSLFEVCLVPACVVSEGRPRPDEWLSPFRGSLDSTRWIAGTISKPQKQAVLGHANADTKRGGRVACRVWRWSAPCFCCNVMKSGNDSFRFRASAAAAEARKETSLA